ncbi:hypothetical protein BH23ACT10_BH23ACT10_25630 [soil metagenome]
MAVTAVLVALFATGCTPAATRPTADAAPNVAASSAGPPPSAGDGATAPPRDTVNACGDEAAELDAVITEQLDAFADDDWERALSLTSQRFLASGVDADGLRRIVTSGYPAAADAADHGVRGCVRDGDDAQVLITVTATDGATLDLIYLMTREDGQWRISGAVDHGAPPSEPPTIET